ncbi:VRR-NUC domain-containing protein [Thermoactinomyces sp. CICC 23799]|uniref:VRR-NUC domain-containing protein n=1 Tax=Thermoactinomyces sp. CICC 23799 TaxID=2767429 RepID=UPI0018DB3A50|nr:VRR-NUC domain-containing protein [Thermoactinomyces sp. CICC 23799]MBH8600504.1 VRR-NUC domain-containing protein [Thermoactinomyces sp. CICC 23799]
MREKQIEQRFKREVERRGGLALKFTPPGWVGAPDRIVLMPGGRVAFVELKAPGGRVRPLQRKRIDELRAMGFYVAVIHSVDGINEFIEEWLS